MKRFRILAVTLSCLVLVAMFVGCAGSKTVVLFPNENLEAAVRYALGKPVGEEITTAELAVLATLEANLEANDYGIADLSGLEYCVNLTELSLWGNQITDISPLSSLTSLTRLGLSGNQISNISPLVENGGLGAGDSVSLKDNNLDLREGSEDMDNIRALEDRGVIIRYE